MVRNADKESGGVTSSSMNRGSRTDVVGGGWIGDSAWGCFRRDIRHEYHDTGTLPATLQRLGVIKGSLRPWARFDGLSSLVCCAVGLALHDVSAEHPIAGDVGIVGANIEGALKANVDFYRDYIGSGRQVARGSLFVHTLPSSPVSQASIQFRLCGPQYHVTPATNRLSEVVAAAALSLTAGDADAMVIVGTHGPEALAVVVATRTGSVDARSLDALVRESGLTSRWGKEQTS